MVLGWALPLVCVTAVDEPGGVRNICRLALGVVQVMLAWIGTDMSLTFSVKVFDTVPAASTWPLRTSVTGAADELATGTSASTHASISARRAVDRLEPIKICLPAVPYEYARLRSD